MKLVEQYLEVVGWKLPFRGRQDIRAELRSLLLDEIEEKYGADPTEDQLKLALKEFGTPAAVARRYHDQQGIIATGFVPFYFFMLKLVLGALSLAFFVIFILSQVQFELDAALTGGMSLMTVLAGLGTFVLTTINVYFSAVGVITLLFIAVSRFGRARAIDLDDDWTPEELMAVEVGPPLVSRAYSIVSIVVLSAMIILMNSFPWIATLAEDLFVKSPVKLGHRLDISLFRVYMHFMSLAWTLELLQHGLILARGSVTKPVKLLEWLAKGSGFIILAALISDSRVYLSYEGMLGFRLVFILFLCINLAEMSGLVWVVLRARLAKGSRL